MKNVALITGASSGIGEEFARIHAEKGGDLVIVARRQDKLESLKTELENKHKISVKVIVKDLSLEEAPKEVYDEIKKAQIEIDFLINNAGFGAVGKFHERDWNKDIDMINVNIKALTTLTHLFLNDFVRKNKGRILNISSMASLLPGGPLQSIYFATKAFVSSFTFALSEELKGTKVTVTALLPGPTKSGFGKVSGLDNTKLFDKLVEARVVAEDGYKAMQQGKLRKVTGTNLGQRIMSAFIPFLPIKLVLKQVRELQETK